jgi:hypothetical protein
VRLSTHPLTVLTPVHPGREPALGDCLGRLPPGAAGPFERVPGTHVARWVLIRRIVSDYPGAPVPPAPLRMQYLLFTSTFDGSVDHHVEGIRTRMAAEADGVWGHCVGYPGSADRAGFHAYLRHNSLPVNRRFAAYDASVPHIRAALRLRERHIAFAPTAQDLPDDQLRRAFLEQFPEQERQPKGLR